MDPCAERELRLCEVMRRRVKIKTENTPILVYRKVGITLRKTRVRGVSLRTPTPHLPSVPPTVR